MASGFLLPEEELAAFQRPAGSSVDAWAAAIAAFAAPLNVSSSMVAYRLHRQAVIDRETWRGLNRQFRSRWLDGQRRQRQKRQRSDGGPTYGVLVRHSLGLGLVELACRLVSSGSLTATKAGRVMGVNPRNAHAVLDAS